MADQTAPGPAEAWASFCDRLREAGETVLGEHGATDQLEAAEGIRFLTRLCSAAFDMFVEHGDTARPGFVRLMHEHRKFYGDNPDTDYDHAAIRGRRRYRIRGHRGSSHYLACCVYGRDDDRRTRIVSNVSDRDFPIDTDGRFDLYLSVEPPPPGETGHWVPLSPDADAVIVRQYYLDRSTEEPASFGIECLDDPGPPPPLSPERVARSVTAAGRFVSTGALFSALAAERFAATPNVVSIDSDATAAAAFYPTPDNRYVGGWFRLDDGEALVVRGRPPLARYWSLLLMSRWMESLDQVHHTTSRNLRRVDLEADGGFRVVVCARDPGVPNWLDTAGHRQGYLLMRWMQAEETQPLTFEVVPLAGLATGA